MPSKTFQPLLFELLAYNWPNSTYVDHYGWRNKKQFSNVNKMYANKSQREKMAMLTKRSRPYASMIGLDEYEYLNDFLDKNQNKISQNKSNKNSKYQHVIFIRINSLE
jgi:hypothetical protein